MMSVVIKFHCQSCLLKKLVANCHNSSYFYNLPFLDQPPLKRRLLAEFNKSKTPHVPFKSSPNGKMHVELFSVSFLYSFILNYLTVITFYFSGVLNDRTIKCNVLLKSNVTLPHR